MVSSYHMSVDLINPFTTNVLFITNQLIDVPCKSIDCLLYEWNIDLNTFLAGAPFYTPHFLNFYAPPFSTQGFLMFQWYGTETLARNSLNWLSGEWVVFSSLFLRLFYCKRIMFQNLSHYFMVPQTLF